MLVQIPQAFIRFAGINGAMNQRNERGFSAGRARLKLGDGAPSPKRTKLNNRYNRLMPRLTISFKEIPLQSVDLELGENGIGRDPSNPVHIDSLAVADFHAVILASPQSYVLKKKSANHPLSVNEEAVIEERELHNGDVISIGKHNLLFTHLAEKALPPETGEPAKPKPIPVSTTPPRFKPLEGNFQIMNGKRIGMVIPLKGAVTQIGKEPAGITVNRSDEGFTITAGSEAVLLTINGLPVTEAEAPLQDGDIVRVNGALLQFFHK